MPQTGWITAEACLLLLNFYRNLLLLNFYCSPLLNFYYNLLLLKPQHLSAHFSVLLRLTQTQIQAALLPLFEEKRAGEIRTGLMRCRRPAPLLLSDLVSQLMR